MDIFTLTLYKKDLSMNIDNKYCSLCSHQLESRRVEGKVRHYCTSCDYIFYLDPKVATVTIVERTQNILLVKRSIQPHLGKWSLPSGYVDRGEKVEEAAIREVKEETNLDIKLMNLIGVYSGKGPVILIVFRASPINGCPSPGEEVSEVSWFQINNLPELPFPFDDDIISDYREVIQ